MTIISLIAALDEAGGLGKNNQLLCHLPADLQYFKATTMGKPIIMGRHTYESIGRPLPGRLNIVLSRTRSSIAGVTVIDSVDQIMEQTSTFPEIMIIGGAQLYEATINMASRLYMTRIHHRFDADVFFPDIDPQIWRCLKSEFRQRDERNLYDLTYYVYERINSNNVGEH